MLMADATTLGPCWSAVFLSGPGPVTPQAVAGQDHTGCPGLGTAHTQQSGEPGG